MFPSAKKRAELTEKYDSLAHSINSINKEEIKRLSGTVKVYQESPNELSERLNASVKVIETKQGSVIHARDLEELKAKAVFIGANGISLYNHSSDRSTSSGWNYDLGDWSGSSNITHYHSCTPIRIER
jgi:hypothetical protein